MLRESGGIPQVQQQVNVNVNVKIEQSQKYEPRETAYTQPDEEHGYKIASTKAYEFRNEFPMDIPLPGVDAGFLRLERRDLGASLWGFMGRSGDPISPKEIVSAAQIAKDRPALPCLLCEWTYQAVDRDGSLLGVLVTMIDPRLAIMREPVRVMMPYGPQVVERVQAITINPILRVTIWRKQ